MHRPGSCSRATQLVVVSQYRCSPHLDIRTPWYVRKDKCPHTDQLQVATGHQVEQEFKDFGSVSTAAPLCLRTEMLTVPSDLLVHYNVSFNSSPKGIPNRSSALRRGRTVNLLLPREEHRTTGHTGVASSTTWKVDRLMFHGPICAPFYSPCRRL